MLEAGLALFFAVQTKVIGYEAAADTGPNMASFYSGTLPCSASSTRKGSGSGFGSVAGAGAGPGHGSGSGSDAGPGSGSGTDA